jgi:hypothetical protein
VEAGLIQVWWPGWEVERRDWACRWQEARGLKVDAELFQTRQRGRDVEV